MGKILLGADRESILHPGLIGLDDVQLDSMDWLVPVADASKARECAREAARNDGAMESGRIDEAWIASSDDVSAINLAAALRADNGMLPVYLVAASPSGSDISRASQAALTGTLSLPEFCERFHSEKRKRSAAKDPTRLEALRLVPPIVPKKDTAAFVLSVMSGSGGVGKSAVVAIAAFMCSRRGFKTVVVDCDLQFGDMGHALGKVPSISIDDALEDPSNVAGLSAAAQDGVPSLVSAPNRLERSEELCSHLAEVLDLLSAEFSLVLVNTGSTWTESHAQLLERSSCAVFMLDQRASSVRSCQHALDLCLRLGIATGPFVYALNRCERGALFTAMDIANVMHGAQVFELKEGGAEVEELMGAGLAEELASSRNDFCTSVAAMLDEVLL